MYNIYCKEKLQVCFCGSKQKDRKMTWREIYSVHKMKKGQILDEAQMLLASGL